MPEPGERAWMRIVVELLEALQLNGTLDLDCLEIFDGRSSGAEMEVTPGHRLDPQPHRPELG